MKPLRTAHRLPSPEGPATENRVTVHQVDPMLPYSGKDEHESFHDLQDQIPELGEDEGASSNNRFAGTHGITRAPLNPPKAKANQAAIDGKFKQLVSQTQHKEVWKSPAFKKGKKYISVFEAVTPGPNGKPLPPYYYAQRLGKDSIAFLAHDTSKPGQLLCLTQFSTPHMALITGTFTGSMDKDGLGPQDIAAEEAEEEAGYLIPEDEIKQRVTKVSSQPVGAGLSNEVVHLFLIDITGIQREDRQPEGLFEHQTVRKWYPTEEVIADHEWKAKLIAIHYMAANHTEE